MSSDKAPEEESSITFRLDEANAAELLTLFLRSKRRERRLSQREMAATLGLTKSTFGRLEDGSADLPFAVVIRVLRQLGMQVTVDVPVLPSSREGAYPGPPDYLDAQGRRMPPHCDAYRLRMPHHWWFVRAPDVSAKYWPEWSFRRKDEPPRVLPVLARDRPSGAEGPYEGTAV